MLIGVIENVLLDFLQSDPQIRVHHKLNPLQFQSKMKEGFLNLI